MRRRSFLLASAALSLQGCSPAAAPHPTIAPVPSSSPSPAVTIPSPPGPDGVPRAFSPTPLWPSVDIATRITAMHRHHLCGAVARSTSRRHSPEATPFLPAVVDLTGPTTWLLSLNPDGGFTTQQTDLVSLLNKDDDHPEPGPVLQCGPAVLDDTAAHLVVAVRRSPDADPREEGSSVHLVKVRLADGQVEATTELAENFPIHNHTEMFLSFSPDRSSLLVAATDYTGSRPRIIGMRLAVSDLSIQFDLSQLGLPIRTAHAAGGAVNIVTDSWSLIVLHDGTRLDDVGEATVVLGEWLLSSTRQGMSTRNLTTGEEHEVTGILTFPGEFLTSTSKLFPQPPLWTERTTHVGISSDSKVKSLTAWTPGTTAPRLQWTEEEQPVPSGAVVYGDVLYSGHPEHDRAALILRALDSGEVLATLPRIVRGGDIGITAWGVSTGGVVLPATDWFA